MQATRPFYFFYLFTIQQGGSVIVIQIEFGRVLFSRNAKSLYNSSSSFDYNEPFRTGTSRYIKRLVYSLVNGYVSARAASTRHNLFYPGCKI